MRQILMRHHKEGDYEWNKCGGGGRAGGGGGGGEKEVELFCHGFRTGSG